ncbi:MAG TPA: cyclic nucleotide-binding and patatin-like phospholipase domain-containing protein [Thermomicrobiales bacterium]|nr:cyclic nucleotide-binding and patatin-like phospholipase domain-containing protein [Thermomicrobiales bacterium]
MQTSALARTPLFAGLDAAALAEVERQLRPRRFAVREALCREGDAGESLFVIEGGVAQVLVGGAAVARLRRGDVVGEMALLTGEARSATVVAATPVAAHELRREAFAALLARHPAVLTNLTAILSRRLARTSARRAAEERRGEAVALLVDERGTDLVAGLVAAAAAASPRGVRAVALRTQDSGLRTKWAEVGGDLVLSPADALGRLDDLLATSGTVLLVADVGGDELPGLLEQVDRAVALVGEEGAGRLTARLGEEAGRVEVALVREADGSAPAAIAGLRVVRACDPARPGPDLAWLGRHVTRTKLGLALGAGGAKGYAHIAALALLEGAGYTVDYVAGSSIGALIGAWLALGRDAAAIEATMRAAFTPDNVAAMFKLSMSGLSSGLEVMTRVCRETTADASFADLTIPLVMMAVDLDAREPAPIVDGALWEGLLAALAVAGVYPPHERAGRRLVDAVALVPVPTEAVAAAGADVTVAVNLLSRDTLPAWPGEAPPPPPAAGRARMLDTLMEVMDLAQLDASVRHAALADVTITPRFGPANWRDFHLADLFLDTGREAAAPGLDALRALARPQRAAG